MSGVGDLMFGSTTDPSVQQVGNLSGGQSAALNQLLKLLQGQIGQGVSSFPGSLTAPASGLQTQSWDQLSGLLEGLGEGSQSQEAIRRLMQGTSGQPWNGGAPAGTEGLPPPGTGNSQSFNPQEILNLFGQSGMGNAANTFNPEQIQNWFQGDFGYTPQGADSQAVSGLFQQGMGNAANTFNPDLVKSWYQQAEFDPTAINNWYQKALVNPALQTWEQDIVPNIQEKFIGQNAGSSGGANRAIARSGEDMMTGLSAQMAQTLFGEKQAHDTRNFQNQQNLASALLGEKGASDTRGFASAQGLVNALLGDRTAGQQREFQAGMEGADMNFQSVMNAAQALLGSSEAANQRGFTASQNLLSSLMGEYGASNARDFTAGQNDLNRLLQIPGMETEALRPLMQALALGSAAGAEQRGVAQEGLNEEYQKWLTEQGYNNPWLRYLTTGLGTNAVENVVNPGSQQQGLFQSAIAPILGSYLGSDSGSSWLTNLFKGSGNPNTPASGTATGVGEGSGGLMDTIGKLPTSIAEYLFGPTPAMTAAEYGSWAGAGEPALTPGSYGQGLLDDLGNYLNQGYDAIFGTGGTIPEGIAGMGEVGSQAGSQFAGWGTGGSSGSTGAGVGAGTGVSAIGATGAATGANLGALTAAEAAGYGGLSGAGVGGAGSAGAGTALGTVAGAAGAVLAPLLTGLSLRSAERKREHAWEDWYNGLTEAQKEAYERYLQPQAAWDKVAANLPGEAVNPSDPFSLTASPIRFQQAPSWLTPEMVFAPEDPNWKQGLYNTTDLNPGNLNPEIPYGSTSSVPTSGAYDTLQQLMNDPANWVNSGMEWDWEGSRRGGGNLMDMYEKVMRERYGDDWQMQQILQNLATQG